MAYALIFIGYNSYMISRCLKFNNPPLKYKPDKYLKETNVKNSVNVIAIGNAYS